MPDARFHVPIPIRSTVFACERTVSRGSECSVASLARLLRSARSAIASVSLHTRRPRGRTTHHLTRPKRAGLVVARGPRNRAVSVLAVGARRKATANALELSHESGLKVTLTPT